MTKTIKIAKTATDNQLKKQLGFSESALAVSRKSVTPTVFGPLQSARPNTRSDVGMGMISTAALDLEVANDKRRVALVRPTSVMMMAAGAGYFARKQSFPLAAVAEVIGKHSKIVSEALAEREFAIAEVLAKAVAPVGRESFKESTYLAGSPQLSVFNAIAEILADGADVTDDLRQVAQAVVGYFLLAAKIENRNETFGAIEARASGLITEDAWQEAAITTNLEGLLETSLATTQRAHSGTNSGKKLSHDGARSVAEAALRGLRMAVRRSIQDVNAAMSLLAYVRVRMLGSEDQVPTMMQRATDSLVDRDNDDLALQNIVLDCTHAIGDAEVDSSYAPIAAGILVAALDSKRFRRVSIAELSDSLEVFIHRGGMNKQPLALVLRQDIMETLSNKALDVSRVADGQYVDISPSVLPTVRLFDTFAAMSSMMTGHDAGGLLRDIAMQMEPAETAIKGQVFTVTALHEIHALNAMAFEMGATRTLLLPQDPKEHTALLASGNLLASTNVDLVWYWAPSFATSGSANSLSERVAQHPIAVILAEIESERPASTKITKGSIDPDELKGMMWSGWTSLPVLPQVSIPDVPMSLTIGGLGEEGNDITVRISRTMLLRSMDQSSTQVVLPEGVHEQVHMMLHLVAMSIQSGNEMMARVATNGLANRIARVADQPITNSTVNDFIWEIAVGVSADRLSSPDVHRMATRSTLMLMCLVMVATEYGSLKYNGNDSYLRLYNPAIDAVNKDLHLQLPR